MKILDHGYVELVESWGSDERIIEAARMSTGKGFNGWGDQGPPCFKVPEQTTACSKGVVGCPLDHKPGDEKLLAYLYNHKHMTPFEMAGMVIEVKAPIFVYREWHRHRTIKVAEIEPHGVESDLPLFADEPVFSFNEMSARYMPLPNENYIPSVERLMMSGGANKQAQGTGTVLTEDRAERFRERLARTYRECQDLYEWAVEIGVPKELARLPVPVARYSRMRASANLRNWLAFLTLRMDPAAQWEIRQYANAVGELIAEKFPHTWELFAKEKNETTTRRPV